MSFSPSGFGTGFSLGSVDRSSIARRFNSLLLTKGESVTIVKRTKVTENDYGEPVWSEDERNAKALVARQGSMDHTGAGDQPRCDVKLHVARWEDLDENGVFEVEIDGERYHVKSVITAEAYRLALLDRRTDA